MLRLARIRRLSCWTIRWAPLFAILDLRLQIKVSLKEYQETPILLWISSAFQNKWKKEPLVYTSNQTQITRWYQERLDANHRNQSYTNWELMTACHIRVLLNASYDHGAQCKYKRKCWFVFYAFLWTFQETDYFRLSCELVVWLTISKYQALEIFYHAHVRAVEGVVGEGESVSWGGARTKGEVHKRKPTENMFLHSDLFKSLSSSLTRLCFMIRKIALRGNGVKILRAINQ